MAQSKKNENLMLTIPKTTRDQLRIMAAKINMEDPEKVTSAGEIAKDLLIEKLNEIQNENSNEKLKRKTNYGNCKQKINNSSR